MAAKKQSVGSSSSSPPKANLTYAKEEIAHAVNGIREIDSVEAMVRRGLNGALDDVQAELGRAQTAMQRLLERSEGGGVSNDVLTG